MERTFSNLYYDHETSLSKGIISAAGTLGLGDRFTSNDYTAGNYKEVDFTQADITIEVKFENSEGVTKYHTVFKGRYMVFEFPKRFNFCLKIVQNHFGGPTPPTLGQRGPKFERISTESSTFNKKFKVYAQDGFEAYYLLGPDLIERIETLSNDIKGRLLICFRDNDLHIAIKDNKDNFEPPNPFLPINEAQELSKVAQEIKVITDFVEYLKLDSKLFKN